MKYKLLTPGPLTTTDTVKKEMMFDHCTWDDDYKKITLKIRNDLLQLAHADGEEYTVILMQGSGTFGVESVLTSSVGKKDKLLIVSNGAYGERMEDIAKHAGLSYAIYHQDYDKQPDVEKIAEILEGDDSITHVSMVHSETTSGILNNIEEVTRVVKNKNCTMIVDAMSSFGGMDIPVQQLEIDFLISSANKCIQGVPGFSFIFAKKEALMKTKEQARSLSLDLYDQWETMNKDGKWRFTSPTHTVLAFAQAIEELKKEGGILARANRYYENNREIRKRFQEMGLEPYIEEKYQGPIITTFIFPKDANFTFEEMYQYIKERGYAIYPGKVMEAETFRIGNIGEIYREDVEALCSIMKEFLEVKKHEN